MSLHKMVDGVRVEMTPEEEAAIRAEWSANDAKQAATAYIENRRGEYPPIGDQLDALWKGGQAQQDMLEKVMAVKAKYPKP